MNLKLAAAVLLWTLFMSCSSQKLLQPAAKQTEQKIVKNSRVILGSENFITEHLSLIQGKRVGLLTNPSGINGKLQSTADLFAANPKIDLRALFGPEHGIRGAVNAGEKVQDETDPKTGLPVYSLYGKNRQPSKEMLKNIDVLIVDIQDIGVRAYTYIYTMAMVMKAAAENHIPVIVLDRPNPIGGVAVEGNLVEKGYFSFVGLYPIPYRHGMTIGELAKLFNTEYKINCDLTVIALSGWTRDMLWDKTGLFWIPPSPHVPHWETVLFMSTTGTYGELHTLSEGVGYTSPFEITGAPWIDGAVLADSLNALHLTGVLFRPLYFKPYYGAFKGQILQGVQLHLTDAVAYKSYSTGFYIMETVMKLYPEHNLFAEKSRVKMFNKVLGCGWIMQDLINRVPVPQIEKKWQKELERFKQIREKYLIYPN